MPKLKFLPQNSEVEVQLNTKILVAAVKAQLPIRYGCGACRCGTCAVAVVEDRMEALSPMEEEELKMLERLNLQTNGSIRMACRARVLNGIVTVDLSFQDTYSP